MSAATAYWANQARAAIRAAQANLCPHLVDRRKTRCAECETTETTARRREREIETTEETDHA